MTPVFPAPKPERKAKAPKRLQRTRMKRRKRNVEETTRKYGTEAFRDFLHATPCLGCGRRHPEQAHFGKHPMGRKNDWTRSGPLCGIHGQDCHGRLDRRETRLPWFTEEERDLLERRLAAFHARWDALSSVPRGTSF